MGALNRTRLYQAARISRCPRIIRLIPIGEGEGSLYLEAVLGLLALMLSFTFAMALTRLDGRRNGVSIEANAIGTATLRAGLLPAPHGTESVKLFRDYVQVRLGLAKQVPTSAELNAAIARSKKFRRRFGGGQSGYGHR